MNPRLIEAHLDGRLTPAEAEELSRTLATNSEARRQFWEYAAVHGLMQEAARLEWLGNVSQKLESNVMHVSGWRWAARLAAAAAVALAGLAFLWQSHSPEERSGNGVAVLSRVVGAEWADGQGSVSKDAVLSPGTLRLKGGALEVVFYTGARVVVQGPSEFQLVSANEGFLRSGKITAHVPPQARGFKVGSANVTVVDYGTDFGFAVSQNATEEVHVFNGRVEVAILGLTPRLLKSGEAIRMENGHLQNIKANQAGFLSEAELAQHDELEGQHHFNAWKAASQLLNQDPDTLLYYNFEGHVEGVRLLPNLATRVDGAIQGNIVGCAWASGRWPGKQALNFHGEGDRVRISIPQSMKQVTFLAWVRIDSLPNGLRSLLSADAQQTGALHWELTNTGRLRLSIGRDLKNRNMDWETVDSGAVITPNRFGQWLMLVTTFDGSRVRHYCNGLPVGSGAAFRPAELAIGSADIGNSQWNGARHFIGGIDELAILQRAMSAEEIHRLYESGKP